MSGHINLINYSLILLLFCCGISYFKRNTNSTRLESILLKKNEDKVKSLFKSI